MQNGQWAAIEGADIVRDVKKLINDSSDQCLKRSDSDPYVVQENVVKASDISMPGGFRREYIARDESSLSRVNLNSIKNFFKETFWYIRLHLTRSEESENDVTASEQDMGERPLSTRNTESHTKHTYENLGGHDSQNRNFECQELREYERAKKANIRQTVLTIMKSFVGSGLLFLPKAFYNGGIFASIVIMILSFIMCLAGMHRLIDCCDKDRETFGQIGYAAYGVFGKRVVNISIIISQLGFCAVYGIFVAANLRDFLYSISGCDKSWRIAFQVFIVTELLVYVPLSWIRRIRYMAFFMLLADVFILIGIVSLMGVSVHEIRTHGQQSVDLINYNTWPLMLGTSIYLWEGTALVLPIRSAMRESYKHKFPRVLTYALLSLLVVYITYSSLALLAYGNKVNSVILLNLPNTWGACVVQFIYTVAAMLSFPLLLFPATKISENRIFGKAKNVNLKTKWMKNAFRTAMVLSTLSASYVGIDYLDNFVALVGSLCCVPLASTFPSLFHIKLSRSKRLRRLQDDAVSPNNDTAQVLHSATSSTNQTNKNDRVQIAMKYLGGGVGDKSASSGYMYSDGDFSKPFLKNYDNVCDDTNVGRSNGCGGDVTSDLQPIGNNNGRTYLFDRLKTFWLSDALDYILISLSIVIAVITTIQAIKNWKPHRLIMRCEQ